MSLPIRHLGPLAVSALGLGCMGMSDFYGARDEEEALATLEHAYDRGITFYDTADMYGWGENERLLGRFLRHHRSGVVIATKFGNVIVGGRRSINGRPEYVSQACEASLRRLGVETIDLYYLHRVDPTVPIEETVGAMAALVHSGKVRYLGLSEAGAETLRRAARVHPIAALQSEYSLWSRDPEQGILETARRLGIGFVAYSPLGRGFLTGAIRRPEDLDPDDWRRRHPRFTGENFARNLRLVDTLQALAKEKGCTPAQLALAWVLDRGDDVVPIPGTKRRRYLDENLGSLDLRLSDEDRRRLEEVFPPGAAAGMRYPEEGMKHVGL